MWIDCETHYSNATLRDFIVGKAASGQVWVKRFIRMKPDNSYADYPLYQFSVDTIGM